MADVVHGIYRRTQEHLCGARGGLGTDAREPAMEITCPMCRYVLEGDGETAFILDIEWDRPSPDSPILPNLVGPFGSRIEAHEWAALNISNGSWECRPLSYPYLRTSPAGGAS